MKLKSIAANQTEIEHADGRTVFFSYSTPVAIFVPGKGALVTTTKHSKTTSRHINKTIARWGATRHDVTQEAIDRLAIDYCSQPNFGDLPDGALFSYVYSPNAMRKSGERAAIDGVTGCEHQIARTVAIEFLR